MINPLQMLLQSLLGGQGAAQDPTMGLGPRPSSFGELPDSYRRTSQNSALAALAASLGAAPRGRLGGAIAQGAQGFIGTRQGALESYQEDYDDILQRSVQRAAQERSARNYERQLDMTQDQYDYGRDRDRAADEEKAANAEKARKQGVSLGSFLDSPDVDLGSYEDILKLQSETDPGGAVGDLSRTLGSNRATDHRTAAERALAGEKDRRNRQKDREGYEFWKRGMEAQGRTAPSFEQYMAAQNAPGVDDKRDMLGLPRPRVSRDKIPDGRGNEWWVDRDSLGETVGTPLMVPSAVEDEKIDPALKSLLGVAEKAAIAAASSDYRNPKSPLEVVNSVIEAQEEITKAWNAKRAKADGSKEEDPSTGTSPKPEDPIASAEVDRFKLAKIVNDLTGSGPIGDRDIFNAIFAAGIRNPAAQALYRREVREALRFRNEQLLGMP